MSALKSGNFEDALVLAILAGVFEELPLAEESYPDAFATAVASLMLFIQGNWTGPSTSLSLPCQSILLQNADRIVENMVADGEYPYSLARHLGLLMVARRLLETLYEARREDHLVALWLLRTLFVHQRLLENHAPSLKSRCLSLLEAERQRLFSGSMPSHAVEAALIYQYYGIEREAASLLRAAGEAGGFEYELTGVLGRRTRHQSKDVAQLKVMVKSCASMPEDRSREQIQPNNIGLCDEVLLEQIEYVAGQPAKPYSLGATEQAILLANATHLQRFNARDEQILEKMLAFINESLTTSVDWLLYSAGLYYRSMAEARSPRTIERAALQLQALVRQIPPTSPAVLERIGAFWIVDMPAEWELDKQQASIFASLGAFRTALEIFEQRQMWEEMVACLVQLGERKKAESLLTAQLARQPDDPKTLCALGELVDDGTFYERAWSVSGGRYARAQRLLGNMYFKKQSWHEARTAYELALALNALFEKTWFLLGCCLMQLSQFDAALSAFHRVVSLDDANSEAWNNIAAIRLRLNQPSEALTALKEAVKRQFDSWRIWENLVWTAMKAGSLTEALWAYRRTVEIRGTNADPSALGDIVEGFERLVLKADGDFDGQSFMHMFDAFIPVLASVSFENKAFVWRCIAKYYRASRQHLHQWEILLKEYRALNTAAAWKTNVHEPDPLRRVVEELKACASVMGDLDGHADRQFMLESIVSKTDSGLALSSAPAH